VKTLVRKKLRLISHKSHNNARLYFINTYILLITETINQSFPLTAGSRTMSGM